MELFTLTIATIFPLYIIKALKEWFQHNHKQAIASALNSIIIALVVELLIIGCYLIK